MRKNHDGNLYLSRICSAFFALLVLLGGSPLGAQTQLGSISGTVKSSDDVTLPEASVTLEGPSMMGRQVVKSDSFGRFRFPGIPPGKDYTIEVSRDGFQGKRYVGFTVEIGQTTLVRIDLETAEISDEISVSATFVPLLDSTTSATSTHFGLDFLENLPVGERSWEDVVLFAPGVVDGSVAGRGNMFSSRGSAVVDNQSAFDGVVNTSAQTNTEGAGIAFETIEQIQVLSGALPAEIGNVSGLYANLVTKSGGNRHQGEGAFYFVNEDLQSDNVSSSLAQAGLEPTLITDYEDWALNLGGPIAKDKLWFNVSAGRRSTSTDISGFPEDETFDNDYRFAKLTWQPRQQHTFVVMYNDHDTNVNHFATVPLSQHTPEATRRKPGENEILKLKWAGSLTNKGLLEIDLAANDQKSSLLAQEGSGPANFDLVTGLLSGGAFQENVFGDSRDQARAAFSWFRGGARGSHELKIGIDYEDSTTDIFSSNDRSPVLAHLLFAGAPGLALFSNSAAGVLTSASIEGLHAYIQDSWQVSNRLTLNLGLRFNSWTGAFPPQTSPAFTYGSNVDIPAITLDQELEALSWSSLEPRIAGTIVLDEDGRSLVRLGLSRYHSGIATSFFNLANPVGFSSSTHAWADSNGDLFADPDEVFPALAQTFASPGAIDPDLEQPYTDEITLSYARKLSSDVSLNLNAFYRETQDLVEDTNISADESSFVPVVIPDAGPDTIPNTADDGTRTVFNQVADFNNILQLTNPELAARESKGLEVVVTKRLSNRWQALGSLVWQESTGTVGNSILTSLGNSASFNDPNARLNLDGALPLDREWQARLLGTYEGPFGILLSGHLSFLTGVPIYRELTVSLNQGAIVVVADPKDTHREEDLLNLDLRVEKSFALGDQRPARLGLSLEVLNLLNGDAVTRSSSTGGTYDVARSSFFAPAGGFAAPQEIQAPRMIRVGAQIRF